MSSRLEQVTSPGPFQAYSFSFFPSSCFFLFFLISIHIPFFLHLFAQFISCSSLLQEISVVRPWLGDMKWQAAGSWLVINPMSHLLAPQAASLTPMVIFQNRDGKASLIFEDQGSFDVSRFCFISIPILNTTTSTQVGAFIVFHALKILLANVCLLCLDDGFEVWYKTSFRYMKSQHYIHSASFSLVCGARHVILHSSLAVCIYSSLRYLSSAVTVLAAGSTVLL